MPTKKSKRKKGPSHKNGEHHSHFNLSDEFAQNELSAGLEKDYKDLSHKLMALKAEIECIEQNFTIFLMKEMNIDKSKVPNFETVVHNMLKSNSVYIGLTQNLRTFESNLAVLKLKMFPVENVILLNGTQENNLKHIEHREGNRSIRDKVHDKEEKWYEHTGEGSLTGERSLTVMSDDVNAQGVRIDQQEMEKKECTNCDALNTMAKISEEANLLENFEHKMTIKYDQDEIGYAQNEVAHHQNEIERILAAVPGNDDKSIISNHS